jgi:altronate dehydratase small subunit
LEVVEMSDIRALIMHDRDNVATLVQEAKKGQRVRAEMRGKSQTVEAREEIPFGFKIAMVDIPQGGTIIKYGELIGRASSSISRGAMVHIHNVEGTRGRGDLEREVK